MPIRPTAVVGQMLQYSGWAIGRMGSRADQHYPAWGQVQLEVGIRHHQMGVGLRQHYTWWQGPDSIITGGGIRHHYSLLLGVGFRKALKLGASCSAWSGDQTAFQMGVGLRQHYCWGQGSESIIAGGGDQTALQLKWSGSDSIIARARVQKVLQLGVGIRPHYSLWLGSDSIIAGCQGSESWGWGSDSIKAGGLAQIAFKLGERMKSFHFFEKMIVRRNQQRQSCS